MNETHLEFSLNFTQVNLFAIYIREFAVTLYWVFMDEDIGKREKGNLNQLENLLPISQICTTFLLKPPSPF